jgi:hypothetical protein
MKHFCYIAAQKSSGADAGFERTLARSPYAMHLAKRLDCGVFSAAFKRLKSSLPVIAHSAFPLCLCGSLPPLILLIRIFRIIRVKNTPQKYGNYPNYPNYPFYHSLFALPLVAPKQSEGGLPQAVRVFRGSKSAAAPCKFGQFGKFVQKTPLKNQAIYTIYHWCHWYG